MNLKEKSTEEIYCQTIDLNSKFAFEFPQINYFRNNGLDYRYIYGINQNFDTQISVTKMDVANPQKVIEKFYDDQSNPSEPVFVPNPNAETEDDGVILTMVLCESGKDYLSILDASNLSEIAKAEMPDGVEGAVTFHGFFAEENMYKELCV